jgi:hypothetical protein
LALKGHSHEVDILNRDMWIKSTSRLIMEAANVAFLALKGQSHEMDILNRDMGIKSIMLIM